MALKLAIDSTSSMGRFHGAAGDSPRWTADLTPSLTDTRRGTTGPAGITRMIASGHSGPTVPLDPHRHQPRQYARREETR